MRIIAFIQTTSGPAYHRIIMPLLLMSNVDSNIDVYITNNLDEKDFEKGCDVLMYNRIVPDHALPTIAKLKKQYGFKVCVDVDDYWELDKHHILYNNYIEQDFASKQIEQLKLADIVMVTNDRLANKVKPFNTNVYILPNAIPKQGQFDIEKIASPFTRLFWQGSQTHRKDIELLLPASAALLQIAPQIKMVMAGYDDNCMEWKSMVHNYTSALRHQYKLIPAEPIVSYYQVYKEADICLIPLLESNFNQYKSNLKVLEAANLGLPCIVSNVHPYKDLPVIYANKSNDWAKEARRLVGSKKQQKEAGAKLKEYCDLHFDFYKINELRKQILCK